MIPFCRSFLIWRGGVAIENACPPLAPFVEFDGFRIGEFTSVVCETDSEYNGKTIFPKKTVQLIEDSDDGRGIIIVPQESEHHLSLYEMYREKNFPSFCTFHGIELRHRSIRVFFHIGKVILIFTADAAKKDALVPLALVHNEISNNTTAAKASSVEKGYISADDYDYIVKTLIDPDRATGLKVVVSSKEIADSDLEQKELDQLLEAADYKIARYADISLLVVTLDTGEYLGSLHRTDDPIDLAIAIPSDVIALDAPVYVLRLHNGVVERLATTVRDGLACFASDLFSKFALGYQVEGLGGDDGLDADPDEDEPAIVPENPENEEPVKAGVTKTSVKKSAGKNAKAAESRVIAAETGDVSDVMLWLVLMGLAAGAAFIAVLTKKVRRM